MTDEEREERNRRNRELLGLKPENLEEHVQREQAREVAIEQFREKREREIPLDLRTLTDDEFKRIDELMDQIIEISGCGGVLMLQPEDAPIISNFAEARGMMPTEWVGQAIFHMMHVEESIHNSGGGQITMSVTLMDKPPKTSRPKRSADGTTVN